MNPSANPSPNPSANPSPNPSLYARAGVPNPSPFPFPTPPPLGTDAQTRGRAIEQPVIARLNDIDRWDALAVIVAAVRPDWRITDVLAVIKRDLRPPRDLLRAAIDAALDPDVRHPGALAHRTAGSATPTPPGRRDATCTTHPGELAANCRGCRADHLARPEEES